MKTIGIVGEVCAGKTTISKILTNVEKLKNKFNGGIIYLEGDSEIRKMYSQNTHIIDKIKAIHSNCVIDNIVDTKILGEYFFANQKNQQTIEDITHPELRNNIVDFIEQNRAKNVLLILDVPVLFKLNLQEFCDYIIFFGAHFEERAARAEERMCKKHDMSAEEAHQRFINIDKIAIKKDKIKRDVAIIDTTNNGQTKDQTISIALDKICRLLL